MTSARATPDGRPERILAILRKKFPEAGTALVHHTPFELLVATILSAQCTDERVNQVTKELFKKYRTPGDFASLPQDVLEREIHSTGFFRMKARNIIACAAALLERHADRVPSTMEELVNLPGVGRKTANVVLSEGFGLNEGIIVDTHVFRVARRLGLAAADDPVKVEQELMRAFPRDAWHDVGLLLILHGRADCNARAPRCNVCPLAPLCPSAALYTKPAPSPKKTRA